MENNLLQSGIRKSVASAPSSDGKDNCVAVSMLGGAVPWLLRFWAMMGGRRIYLGGVRTSVVRSERLVAVVSCPGADNFEVEGQCYQSGLNDHVAISFNGVAACGGPWGVQAIPGLSVPGARSSRVAAGVAGAVNVLGEVHTWSASSAVGGTLSILVSPGLTIGPITIPAGVPVGGDFRGMLGPETTWTFVGTDSYMVEVAPPGGLLDG